MSTKLVVLMMLDCILVLIAGLTMQVTSAVEEVGQNALANAEPTDLHFAASGARVGVGITDTNTTSPRKRFWSGRKLMAACAINDVLTFNNWAGYNLGTDTYRVVISWGNCHCSWCRLSNVIIYCRDFPSDQELTDPNVFKKISSSTCVVNNGGYINYGASVEFYYRINSDLQKPLLYTSSVTITNC